MSEQPLALTSSKHYQALADLDLDSVVHVASGDEIDEFNLAPRGKAEVADPMRDKFVAWAESQQKHFFALAQKNGKDPAPFTRDYPPRVIPVQTKEQMEAVRAYAQSSATRVGMGIRFAQGSEKPREDGTYKVAYCLVRKSERKPRSDKKVTANSATDITAE